MPLQALRILACRGGEMIVEVFKHYLSLKSLVTKNKKARN
jgi:hypothetical protein